MQPNQRVRRGLGYVPQGQLCFPQLTTLENLQLVADRRPNGDAPDRRGARHVPGPARPAGPAGRAALGWPAPAARRSRATLLTEPRLLILDEPTEGIQPNVVAEIERVIASLTERGDLSVLLVEQHVGFALRATSYYYVLESGRVTSHGEGGRRRGGRRPRRDGGLSRAPDTERHREAAARRGRDGRPRPARPRRPAQLPGDGRAAEHLGDRAGPRRAAASPS